MPEPPSNLRSLFVAAKELQDQLDSLLTTSQQYQERLQAAISAFLECRRWVDGASLFSPNESQDDISSKDLQYLSIDYHVGHLLPGATNVDRKSQLHSAQDAYGRFLHLLDTYDILSAADRKLYERYNHSEDDFVLVVDSDASRRREIKIARLVQEKALGQKLEHLARDPTALQNDDAALRELRFAELALYTHRTFYALDFVAQELKILALAPPSPPPGAAPALEADRRLRHPLPRDDYSERLDPSLSSLLRGGTSGPILGKDGKPLQPFVLLDSRQRLRDGVFRPGHNLPTMTIDEYLEEERRRGGIVDGGGEVPEKVVDEDDMKAADEGTMKAREWDEFKEANPRGSGNTLNRG